MQSYLLKQCTLLDLRCQVNKVLSLEGLFELLYRKVGRFLSFSRISKPSQNLTLDDVCWKETVN